VRNWPAFAEWSTRSVRDAFFASPKFPRLLNANAIKETIAKGVTNGFVGYVGKGSGDDYQPFVYGTSLQSGDVEISEDIEDMYIITKETAEAYQRAKTEARKLTTLTIAPAHVALKAGEQRRFTAQGYDQHNKELSIEGITWSASGGFMTPDGTFVAGSESATITVTASLGSVSADAIVQVRPADLSPIHDGQEPPTGDNQPEPSEKRQPQPTTPVRLIWQGEIPWQKWSNFYPKILAKFATSKGLRLTLRIEVAPDKGVSTQQVEEMKIGLRELGLDDSVRTE
jgi:hypothetical protein